MSKFTDSVHEDTPRLVVLFKHDDNMDEQYQLRLCRYNGVMPGQPSGYFYLIQGPDSFAEAFAALEREIIASFGIPSWVIPLHPFQDQRSEQPLTTDGTQ